jgi:hypothetical protein
MQFDAFIIRCVDDGMSPPFVIVSIAANGAVVVSNLANGHSETLCEHVVGTGLALPIRVVAIALSNGRTASTLLTDSEGLALQ